MKSLLFVCLHNACRSRIAEAIAAQAAPSDWLIGSAGTAPSDGVDPKAAELMRRHGLTPPAGRPRSLNALSGRRWDVVIAMGCGDTRDLVRAGSYGTWFVPDPYDGPTAVYEALYEELRGRVTRLLQELGGA